MLPHSGLPRYGCLQTSPGPTLRGGQTSPSSTTSCFPSPSPSSSFCSEFSSRGASSDLSAPGWASRLPQGEQVGRWSRWAGSGCSKTYSGARQKSRQRWRRPGRAGGGTARSWSGAVLCIGQRSRSVTVRFINFRSWSGTVSDVDYE